MPFHRGPVRQRLLLLLSCVLLPLIGTLGLVGVALLSAPSAAAKGAQSAVLFSAATDKTVILTEPDSDIRTLAELLPPYRDGHAPDSPPAGKGTATAPDAGAQITVMWRGGHDTVFSVDAVLPHYDGTAAWVRKEDNVLGGTPRDRWFRADPQLLPLLARLGLYGERAQSQRPAARATPESASHPPSRPISAAASDPDPAATGWWWAGPGLAAGVLLGVVGTLRLRRGRSRSDGAGPPAGSR